MITIEGNNINEIQLQLFSQLSKNGAEVFTRNMEVLEIYPVLLKLTNINNRCTTIFERKWNFIFALGELSWHLSQSDGLNFINYYTKNWNIASDDGITIKQSCYGKKMFNSKIWNNLITELTNDNESRRAVINLYDNINLGLNPKDVSCTLTLQFLIRNGKLDLITNMRSNDIVWGLPNDIFIFTMVQEILALELKIETGNYYHQVNSLHIYKKHFNLMKNILKNPKYFDFSMPKMTAIENIPKFIHLEKRIRENSELEFDNLDNYWNELLHALQLRSTNYSNDFKDFLIDKSPFKEVIKLCPTMYIKNSGVSAKNECITIK